ncbi:hypothetical protein LGH82_27690 [Mesorhizobium sp. PAMC28654]|uniref:hypothetical protein n=1 Tax=Mesorhizobium sp. PAMC28654 TaxID=2880934 RepID=UPI001D0BA757|nr:hypothetical protein [Mesorhizobium sp. PAMC28654]UDL88851.1 hypothetical protein LGH82_27690 [Mesorhizobium sp. PAMC28654]
MEKLRAHIEFVKEQEAFHMRQADKFADNPRRKEAHLRTSSKLGDLASVLQELQLMDFPDKKPAGERRRLNLTWEEVKDLPEELLAELSVSDSDRLEFTIIAIIEDAGGVASLDRIIMEYYKRTGEVLKRPVMNNRLYRMVQKEAIHAVQGKKGVYTLQPLSDEDAAAVI